MLDARVTVIWTPVVEGTPVGRLRLDKTCASDVGTCEMTTRVVSDGLKATVGPSSSPAPPCCPSDFGGFDMANGRTDELDPKTAEIDEGKE